MTAAETKLRTFARKNGWNELQIIAVHKFLIKLAKIAGKAKSQEIKKAA